MGAAMVASIVVLPWWIKVDVLKNVIKHQITKQLQNNAYLAIPGVMVALVEHKLTVKHVVLVSLMSLEYVANALSTV